MGVVKYKKRGKTVWRVDAWLSLPGGLRRRWRQSGIPTREMAVALERKAQAEAFEGRWFDPVSDNTFTVQECWDLYEPVSERHRSWQTEKNLAKCMLEHLGKHLAMSLNVGVVDAYRGKRLRQRTRRGTSPAPATLDREVELLKRILNYAVECEQIPLNPIARVKFLREANTRREVLDQDKFEKLLEHTDERIKSILVLAFESGMRKEEILSLTWDQVDLAEGVINLSPRDTKTSEPRTIILTDLAHEAIDSQPRSLSGYVFTNPRTGTRWKDIRSLFVKARKKAKMPRLWFHDLRRSFVTEARRRGIPESVVMQMSGHKTTAVFRRYNIISTQDLVEAKALFERGRQKKDREQSDQVEEQVASA